MNKTKNREVYADWITRYYASHKYIPDGHSDAELIGRLIRCKDCKYFYKEERYCVLGTVAISDGYCYLGERKEE